ncbi:MAG: methylmalonyl-CoA mutase family protein [Dermatophilaceae bacterium]
MHDRRRGASTTRCASTRRSRAEQKARLAALRAERDNDAVAAALKAMQDAARGTDNVLYPMREALRLKATGGEVAHALREVWGVYVPTDAF